jgi:hypothetical protein
MMSFSEHFCAKSIGKYSSGEVSYGSWSTECWEYFVSLSTACLDIMPSAGWRMPVMRWKRVDLLVPFAPRMAMWESMPDITRGEHNKSALTERAHALDAKRQLFVEEVLLEARIGKGHLFEGDDGQGQLPHVFEVEMEWFALLDLPDEPSGFHLVDHLLLGFAWRTRFVYVPADTINLLMCWISSCCFWYTFIWLTSFSCFVQMYVVWLPA